MVPCLDMVNHASHASAYYEQTSNGDVVLLLRPDQNIKAEDQITISYGNTKSAAEMLFSYGFIDNATSATSLVLDLAAVNEDPLGKAKVVAFGDRPVVSISEEDGIVKWDSPFIFLMGLNEEDGLSFRMLQELDGTQSKLRTFWLETDVTESTHKFEEHINCHPLRDIFILRAVSLLQDRLQDQLERLYASEALLELDPNTDDGIFSAASKLRSLETTLLEKAYHSLDIQVCSVAKDLFFSSQLIPLSQKSLLIESPAVVKYLKSMQGDNPSDETLKIAASANDNEEDFS
jgi:hypothetical protein